MGRWYRALVVFMALAAILCTSAAGYACMKILDAGEYVLSDETLLRGIGEWLMRK